MHNQSEHEQSEQDEAEVDRRFKVHAIEADLVMNKFGLHVPNGAMYVLDEQLEEVRELREALRGFRRIARKLFDMAREAIRTHVDSDEEVQEEDRLAVQSAIEDHGSEDDDRFEEIPLGYQAEAAQAYRSAVDHLLSAVDQDCRTEAQLLQAVEEAASEYVDSVPEPLNPLDDAYAMIEDENRKAPSPLQPLVVRANEGETVEIEFVNHLNRHASIHQTALPYDVNTSDGMAVGRNPDTSAPPEESITYRWEARFRGTHFFYDGANQAFDSAPVRPQQSNLLARGLFGAIVVEPEGARWTDPQTGEDLRSGVRAVIHDPNKYETHYREFVVFYHSPVGVQPDITWPGSDQEQSQHAINYRCDPTGQRVNDDCVKCDTEKFFYHSWTNGDPGGGDNAYTAYKGDPIKFCFVGASHEENHVHHLHQHRYKEIPRKTDSATIDAQTIGLGDTYESYLVAGHGSGTVRPEMDFDEAFRESGAGYAHGTAGDILFHCHLFPHYAEGMWGLMRVLDKEHPFLEPLPQTDIIENPDSDEPPLPPGKLIGKDADVPGFPNFIGSAIEEVEGVDNPKGHAAPQPPNLAIDDPRPPTEQEREAMGEEILPGAPYRDPVMEDPTSEDPNRIVTYDIVITRTPIAYNDAGDHDPNGVVYALEQVDISPGPEESPSDIVGATDGPKQVEDADRIRSGKMNPEPLFLRANVGDCVRVRMRNDLDPIRMGEKTKRWDASIHPHYIGYDVLATDSLPNGFNYYQADKPGQVIESRWYADEEGTIYFHDHIFAIKEGVHGMFCGFIVEPLGSTWRDPYSDEPIYAGAQANIVPPDGEDAFREQALHYHDFAPLKNPSGEFVNPETEHTVNKGTMAINYRNAPYYHRDEAPGSGDGGDPAYVHSSAVHGDPPTPVVEAYDGDPIRLRVFQGAYEEQHTFGVHGLRTERELVPTENSVSKYLGTSEAFTFEISGAETAREGYETENPDGIPVRDYLYGSNVVDDLWTGMWGLVRLWGGEVDHLQSLDDRTPPAPALSVGDLEKMGHPAVHSQIDWTDEGQQAKQLYSSIYLPTDDEESLTDSDIHLPDSDWPDPFDLHRRRSAIFKSLLLPADVAARRNEAIGAVPPSPDVSNRFPGGAGSGDDKDEGDVREYNVTAFATEIPYNDYGDHDPLGVVFAPDRYVNEIKSGDRPPQPLVLRVNEGERLRINLTNDLPDSLDNDHPHPEMLIQEDWERSDRISLHPLELAYDVNTDSGMAVGFNFDTTVGSGDTYTYEWKADGAVGTACLWDMADVRSTRHHGAYGLITVNPVDSLPLTPDTAEPAVYGSSAMVKTDSAETDFREHGLLFADSQHVLNRHDPSNCVVPPGEEGGEESGGTTAPCTQIPEDTEDQGYGAVNYRSEPFERRFETDDDQHRVFDSTIHGDPNTPVVEAIQGEPVRFRVACVGDKARAITFHLAGHEWDRFRDVGQSPQIGVDGQFGPGTAMTLSPTKGAGGPVGAPGDYLYQETKQRRRLESGMWGIFRVRESAQAAVSAIQPLPDRASAVPLENRPGFVVEADTDFTGSGETDVIVGVPGSDLGAVNGGGLYVFVDASKSAVMDLSGADLMVLSEQSSDHLGREIQSVARTEDDGRDLLVRGDTEEFRIRGGHDLRDLTDRLAADQESNSEVGRFVRSAMPSDNWPVLSLAEASDSR